MALGDPYITDAQLKAYMRIDGAQDDTQIGVAVNAATREVNTFCGRQFNDAGATSTRVFRSDTGRLARIDDFSTVVGLVVKVGSTGAYSTTLTIDQDFVTEPLNNARGTELPIADEPGTLWRLRSLRGHIFTSNIHLADPNLEVEARWGWSAIPEAATQATYILGARIMRRRDSPEGIIGGFEDIAVRVGTKMDPDVKALLTPYRKHKQGMFV